MDLIKKNKNSIFHVVKVHLLKMLSKNPLVKDRSGSSCSIMWQVMGTFSAVSTVYSRCRAQNDGQLLEENLLDIDNNYLDTHPKITRISIESDPFDLPVRGIYYYEGTYNI